MAVVVETLMAEDLELGTGTTSKTHPAGGTLNGTQISLSTFSVAGASGTATTSTIGSDNVISSLGESQVTVTVPGAALGDFVLVSCDGLLAKKAIVSATVSATNTVTITIYNFSSAAITLASGHIWSVLVFKCR